MRLYEGQQRPGTPKASTESSGVVRNGDEKETKDNKRAQRGERRSHQGILMSSGLLDILGGTYRKVLEQYSTPLPYSTPFLMMLAPHILHSGEVSGIMVLP